MPFSKNDESFVGESNKRLSGLQPARVILVGSDLLIEEWLAKNLIDALEKIFLLGANINGACPIPLLGIYLLTIYPELVLPLSHTKANFPRLYSSLKDLLSFRTDNEKLLQSRISESCVKEGITEACRQFKRFIGNAPAASVNFDQLEVIFLTTNDGNDVRKQFAVLPDEADLNVLKRIVCVTISSMLKDTSIESQETPLDSPDEDFNSLVDIVSIEGDPLSLQKFFYSWLGDTTSDLEQLQIILPSPSPVDPHLVIKCDLSERIINPLQLPVHDAFSVDSKSNMCKRIFPPASKSLGIVSPAFQLKILSSIPKSTICESVLYGHPILVLPTSCWKMDWEYLEKNQEMFTALCAEMIQKDQVLLGCLLCENSNNRAGLTDCTASSNPFDSEKPVFGNKRPSGHFILMASKKSLLIKSVTSGELYLPSSDNISAGSVNEENQLRVHSSLSKVKELSSFNPFDFQCGLFDALRHSSLPKSYFNKYRTMHQPYQRKPAAKKTERPTVIKPGDRLTARSWCGKTQNSV